MTLDMYTSDELSEFHQTTFEMGKRLLNASLALTDSLGELDPNSAQYANLRNVRNVTLAAGQEMEELLRSIGAEMRRRAAVEAEARGE